MFSIDTSSTIKSADEHTSVCSGASRATQTGAIKADKAVMLAPMEDITNISYREICRELGAEMVFTEFVNAHGLVRGCKRGKKKMEILDSERPVGIQIYGNDTHSMVQSACLAAENNPNLIDINAGCWVKKVSSRGAGAGLLKDPSYMQEMVEKVVKAVHLPVTVKTRIGWDEGSINIVEIAKRLEDVGVQMLTIHARTRSAGHSGKPAWHFIDEVKKVVGIPIILNGGIMEAEDAMTAFRETNADGVMIARGAIGRPWIFQEVAQLKKYGKIVKPFTLAEKIALCMRHLKRTVKLMGEQHGVSTFRKYYSGYLKGFRGAAQLRLKLVRALSVYEVEELLGTFLLTFEKEEFLYKNTVQASDYA